MRAFLLIVVLTAVGCVAKPKLEPPTVSMEPGIYRVSDGETLTETELWITLSGARVVLVGESHDSAKDHDVQLQVLNSVTSVQAVGLGMEMFQRPFQSVLDMFVAGDLDEEEMLAQTEWEDRWGFETDLYRPLWQLARDRGLPIVALNARRELTKRIAKVGVAGLTDTEKADLVELDLSDEKYRAWLKSVFRSHGAKMDDKKMDNFFEAQVTWDETMADTAARWVATHPESTLVVAVGRGHVERDWGIPSRLRRRLDAQEGDGTVISVVPVDRDEVPRWTWMQKHSFADYIWVH